MRQPIEHWAKEWPDKNPKYEDRKKVTSCTRCDTGTAYFRAGPHDYICDDCVAAWYPNKTKAEIALFFDAQEAELERVRAHEAYKQKKKCARCGNAVSTPRNRTGQAFNRIYCGECFDLAGTLKQEAQT